MEYLILGPLAVTHAGEPLALGGLRQRAVLAALVLAGDRGLPIDRLIEQVWGDSPPPKPLVSVRAYVANLRRILPGGADRLLSDADGYRLATSRDVVDARSFEELVGRGRRMLAAGDAAGAAPTLAGALARWRGLPLSDLRELPFVFPHGQRLESLRADAVEAHFDAGLLLGRDAELIGELETELDDNPMRERLWWQLMLSMYRAGRRTEALRAYERVQAVLDRELGVTPGLALQRLASDIRHESAELDWKPADVPLGIGLGPSTSDGLFGRANERRRANDALIAAAERRRGSVLVLTGESGMGKTALARDVATTADSLGMATVWVGHAGETRRPPSWAWTQALRELAGQLGRGADPGLQAPLPQWWGAAAEDVNTSDPKADNGFDVLHATVSALSEIAGRRSALIVLDDLHRADPVTHEVLELLASSIHRMPLLVLATWQDGASPGPHGGRTYDHLLNRTDVDSIALRGLEPDAAAALIAEVSGVSPHADFVAAVHRRTGGNPFYITELVHLLADAGDLDELNAARVESGVPVAVSGVIAKRMADLPDVTRVALSAAAVMGPEFAVSRLATMQRGTIAELMDALEPARRAGLITESPDQLGCLRFSHGLVRDAVAAQTSGLQRARLHAQAARGYAHDGAVGDLDDPISQDAIDGGYHAWQAGTELEPATALMLLDHARADAWNRSAYREVAELDRRALEVCARMPDDPVRRDHELNLRMQLASTEAVVDGQSSAKVLHGLRRSADDGPDVVQSTTTVAMGCLEACGAGRYHDAAVLSDSLVEFYCSTGDSIAGSAGYYIRALTQFMRGRLDAALEAVDVLTGEVPDVDFQRYGAMASFKVLVHGVAAHAHGLRGEHDAAAAALASGITLGLDRDDAFGTVVMRTADLQLAAMTGAYAGLAPRAERVLDDLTALGIEQFIGGARAIASWARAMDDGEDTAEEVRGALARHSQGGRRIFSPLYYGLLSDTCAATDDATSAQASLVTAESIAAATGERVWEAQLSARRLKLVALQRVDKPSAGHSLRPTPPNPAPASAG